MAVLIEIISINIEKDSIGKKLSANHYVALMDYIVENPSCIDEDICYIHMNSPLVMIDT